MRSSVRPLLMLVLCGAVAACSGRRGNETGVSVSPAAEPAVAPATPQAAQPVPTRTPPARNCVLLLVSSAGRDGGETRPGFEMDELAQAWAILRDNGFEAEFVSPAGGPVIADPHNPEDPANARFLADPDAARLAHTRRAADVGPHECAALFVMGGKGAMFDLAVDPTVASLVSAVHEAGRPVAAVCHGTAALLDARDADGRPIVAGRALTGFSNEEEAQFGKRWAREFPYLLEDRARERGARWSEAALMLPHVVADGLLVTGQNPYSTAGTTESLVRQLGREPVARTPHRDERAMAVVQRLLDGDADGAAAQLAADPAGQHVDLIAILGHYHRLAATDDAARRRALAIMALAAPHVDFPQLHESRIEGHLALGERAPAQALLAELERAHPDFEGLAALRTRLAAADGPHARTGDGATGD